jgi:hypothetical protein
MSERESLGERSENINNINRISSLFDIINHKKITLRVDPLLKYYLVTYVCNYTNDSQKSYETLYQISKTLYENESSHMAIGWEINSRGYMHVHMCIGFKRVPRFNKYKKQGCQLNYKPIPNKQKDITRVCNYINKHYEEYGFSSIAVKMEHSFHYYSIQEE